ncbi:MULTISPECIES: LysR family transcriptional regulator [unclassified Achromobacter]|uniref:LysR family transcriptional regulator n=1 Tax=unclassified Achromobacter TaxID=2626865 RepID=UPI0013037271|nr:MULTISPECIES: LysR family transcriptional regulator [unclassified Achromobacter]
MDLNRLDLNLLKIFDAVYRLRSLTEVAKEVHLSQPAVSHALGRLREALGDRLFIRTAEGLTPTARCERLAPPVRAALETIRDSLQDTANFCPADCTREFRVLLTDVGEMLLVPPLIAHLRSVAPQVKLAIFQAPRTHYERMLGEHEVDIAISNLNLQRQTLRRESLFRDHCVVLRRARADDTRATAGPLTLEEFERSHHVLISPPHDPVEQVLAQLNITRKTQLRLPNYFALPRVLASSDWLVTVPSRIASYLQSYVALDIEDVPFPSPVFDVRMYWHTRHDTDPAHSWLREVFLTVFQAAPEPEALDT